MKNRYAILKQLIDLWEVFENEGDGSSLLDFSEWMTVQLKKSPDLNVKTLPVKLKTDPGDVNKYVQSLSDSARFLEYISRISRYHELYMRKFLAELPVNNRTEFLFLKTLMQWERVKKTDLINIHLVDYTTGMDTIKRLIKSDLLMETPDENDKRAKLLEITDKGREVIGMVEKRVGDEMNMFLACINVNKWKKTMPVLEEMNLFHHSIYLKHNDKTASELLNLMDSLKRLNK
jgi:DNA-binding MarR family transcriptional regulator